MWNAYPHAQHIVGTHLTIALVVTVSVESSDHFWPNVAVEESRVIAMT